MSKQITLGLIKPDAVAANNHGKILDMIAASPLELIAIKKVKMSKEVAECFYDVHKEKPFYGELVNFISSGPVYALAMEGDNAILDWRTLMGATNFEEAEEGTIRKKFATSINNNAVHGSDSVENATMELSFFFSSMEFVR